ncbi:hypothetical protein BD769DRAFT_1019040 [Suillus cothurnatus]|nr:hypothetical protein BD769DRAFT_1019040 [Suillus cothurnatus]
MVHIPLAPAPPVSGPASSSPAQYFTKIRDAAAAIVDRFELCAKDLLKLKAAFEQVIRRLDRMQHEFDDVVMRSNGIEETLDRLGETLKGMGETLDYIGEVSNVTVGTLGGMDETFDDIVKKVFALEEKVKVMEKRIDEQISGNGLWPIRLFNRLRSLDESLAWPSVSNPPYPAGKPNTLAELQSMSSEMCTALAAALRLLNPPIPIPPPLEWRRNQIIKHLGCAEFDSMSHSIVLYY